MEKTTTPIWVKRKWEETKVLSWLLALVELNSASSNEKVMARAVFHEILKGRTRIPAVRNEDFKGTKEAGIIIVCLCRGSPRE